jgi:hypothetical protein
MGLYGFYYNLYTLWLTNIAVETMDHLEIGDLPLQILIFHSFLYVYQRVWTTVMARNTSYKY